jgi:hypothetical protein
VRRQGLRDVPRAPRQYCYAHQLRIELYGDPLGNKPLLREQQGTVACCQDGGCNYDLCPQGGDGSASAVWAPSESRYAAIHDATTLTVREERNRTRPTCPSH